MTRELEVMRLDSVEEDQILQVMEQGTNEVLGNSGKKVFEIMRQLSDSHAVFDSEDPEIVRNFYKEIDSLVSQYINQSIQAAHDTLMVTTKREQRLKLIV